MPRTSHLPFRTRIQANGSILQSRSGCARGGSRRVQPGCTAGRWPGPAVRETRLTAWRVLCTGHGLVQIVPCRPGSSHDLCLCEECHRPRPAIRRRTVRDRHVPARVADDRGRSQCLDCVHANDADGVLRGHGPLPDRLRPDLRHGRPQAAALCRPDVVHPWIDWMRLVAQHRRADRLPLLARHRRIGSHGHSACRHPRPAYRHRSHTADGACHACSQRIADARSVRRQCPDRIVRLARGFRNDHCRSRARVHSDNLVPTGDEAAARSAGCCAIGIFSA